MGMNDVHSLSHSKWNCKYHIVFAPKYRRKVFYQGKKAAIGKILRQLCEWKGVKIIEAEACPEHIHLFVEIPPKISVSGFMGYLKGKSAAMMYEQFVELKYKYRSKEFWCKGYYVDTVKKPAMHSSRKSWPSRQRSKSRRKRSCKAAPTQTASAPA